MNREQAEKAAKVLKRSPKYNRKFKVQGIIGGKRGYHVQVVSKIEDKKKGLFVGKVFNYPMEAKSD